MTRVRSPRRMGLMALGLSGLAFGACRSRPYDPVPLSPVAGQVFVNGQPAGDAELTFHPVEPEGEVALTPVARVEPDGSFALTTYEDSDGAPPGAYRVTIVWPDRRPVGGPGPVPPPPDRLGGRYASPENAPWSARVEDGRNGLDPFRLDGVPLDEPRRGGRRPIGID